MEPTPPGLGRMATALPSGNERAGDGLPAEDGAFGSPRIGIIRNPRSHRNRHAASQDIIDPALLVSAPRSPEELTGALTDFARQGTDILIVDGGDGTMREVLTRGAPIFEDAWPKFIVLPKGKTNALAIELGLPDKWSLAEALRTARGSQRIVTRRPIVAARQDGGTHVLGFILGTGVFNAAIEAGQVAHRFGAFQSFAVAVTAIFGILQALFGIGGSRWRALSGMTIGTGAEHTEIPRSRHGAPGKRFAAGLSTLSQFPLGIRPFARDGQGIHYLVFDAPLRRAMLLAPAILLGLDRPSLKNLGIHRGSAEALTLDLDGPFILDGEAFPPGRYSLALGPELQFLIP